MHVKEAINGYIKRGISPAKTFLIFDRFYLFYKVRVLSFDVIHNKRLHQKHDSL